MRAPRDPGLKLLAEDQEDLAVFSAHLQDAILRVGDIAYLPKARRLALTVNRFRWERPAEKLDGREVYRRCTSGVHFDDVLSVQSKGIDNANVEGLLYLLALRYVSEPKKGMIEFEFAGGVSLRAEVEAIDGALQDLNAGWLTDVKPQHDALAGGK